jgi:di/tricarboxylate transporter
MVALLVIPIVGDRTSGTRRACATSTSTCPEPPPRSRGPSGLSSPATVTVLAMFILSAGVQRSGLMHTLGRKVMPFVGHSEVRVFLVIMPTVGLYEFTDFARVGAPLNAILAVFTSTAICGSGSLDHANGCQRSYLSFIVS